MERSESIKALTSGLAIFHSNVGKIKKDSKNPFFKSSYASLSHILEEISDSLEKAGLVISQWPDGSNLVTMLIHAESGEYLSSSYNMPVAKANDPQAVGSAISYARRYAVSSILSLNVSDDDGNKASGVGQVVELPWLNKADFDKASDYLRTGGKIEVIKSKYRISTEMMKNLLTITEKL
jgi:hypothetical protein